MIFLLSALAFAQSSWQELAPAGADDATAVIDYALWDPIQAAVFRQCADSFVDNHPHVRVEIRIIDRTLYWEHVLDELEEGKGPDAFVVDLEHVPDLAREGRLVDLEPLAVSDKASSRIYTGRLENLWVRAGHRWAWPKDWRPIALAYDRDVLRASGVSERELVTARWDPDNGGTFESIVKRLSKRGRYGLAMHDIGGGAPFGYQDWSYLAYAHGFRFTDFLYARGVDYDDPRLVGALSWTARGIREGWVAPIDVATGEDLFLEGKAALVAVSANAVDRIAAGGRDVGFAPLPKGRGSADRVDIVRGTGDAVNAATPARDEAWWWVRHLGSVECQVRMGDSGVGFPGLDAGIEHALEAHRLRGNDLSAFVHQGRASSQVLAPVIDQTTAVRDLADPVIRGILSGRLHDVKAALEKLEDDIDDIYWRELTAREGKP